MSYDNLFTAYGPIYSFKHYDLQGDLWRIRIWEEGESPTNTPTEYNLTNQMFTLTYEGEEIKEGRLEFDWLLEDVTAYNAMKDLVGDGGDKYAVELQKNSSRYWTGFLVPDLIEVTEGDYPRVAKLTAKDMISLNVEFARDTDKSLANYDRLIELFAEVLPFPNDIKTYTNWTNPDLSSGDWLYQTYLDRTVFRKILPEDAEGNYTKKEVLEQLAFAADVYVIQSEGDWHLMQRDYLDNSTYTRYNYTNLGAQDTPASSSSVDLDESINNADRWLLPASTAFWMGGIKRNSYEYFHSSRQYDFRFPASISIATGGAAESFERVFISDGGQKLQLNFRMIALGTPTTGGLTATDAFSKTATINIRIRAGASGSYFYWNGSTWTASDTTIADLNAEGFLSNENGIPVYNFTQLITITTDEVPDAADGTLLIEFREASSSGIDFSTTFFDGIQFEIISSTEEKNSDELTFSLANDGSYTVTEQYGKYIIGDGPNPYSRGSLRYTSGGLYPIFAGSWKREGVTETKNFEEMILRSRMDEERIPVKVIRAEIYGAYSPHKMIAYDSGRYRFDRGVFVGKEGRWRSTYIIEINPTSASTAGHTDELSTTPAGVLPDLPEATSTGSGISANRLNFWDFVTGVSVQAADFGSNGASAPTGSENGAEFVDGDTVYNTVDGDTVPYRFLGIQKYYDRSDFRTSADGYTATGGTVTFGEQAAVTGERGTGRGLLEFVSNTTGSGQNAVSLASPPFDGYFRLEVYIPSTNTTLLGIKVAAPGTVGTTTTTDSWVTLEGGVNSASTFYVYGTDSGGNTTFTRTSGDIFLVRNVEYYGNVVDLDTSGNVSTAYDQKTFSYRVNIDVLLVQDVTDDSIESWGYITSVSGTPGTVQEVALQTTKAAKYIIYGVLRRAITSIKGDYITTGTLDASVVNVTNLNAGEITTWTATVDGTLTIGSGGSIVGSNYSFDDTGGTIAGWTIDAAALTSASSGARIELRQDDKRVVVHDGTNEIVAMGFLEGLPKNDGTGNWTSTTYGFWAKDSESLQIDGDVSYEDGDWIIQNLGAYIVVDSSNNEVIRLGYFDPPGSDPLDYGLWFLKNDGNLLGYVKGDEIKIGVSGQSMTYSPAGGLVVEGTVTATSLVTTNFSGTSAGVTIDDTGLTSNEGIVVGDSGTAGKIELKTAGGTSVGEILAAGSLSTSSMVLSGTAANEYLTLQSGPAGTTVESDIQLLGTGSAIGPSVAQVLVDPLLNIGTSVSSYTGKLHIAGDVRWDGTTTTSATAGTNGDVPAQVVGYLQVNISGTNRKIPFYA
ncbi:MAG: hypothetical protein ACO39F_04115 [Candidatus Nanopelagicaceae bacterium]